MNMISESAAVALGVLSIGFIFGTALFGATAHDKTGKMIARVLAGLAALCVIFMIYIPIHNMCLQKERGFTEYTLKLYYLGGSQEVKNFVTDYDCFPYIHSYKGSYTLEGTFEPEQGVVRFEVLSKRNIPYEDFANRK